ncbi:MAG: ABC transporter ATP-binding protein [Vulcanimicrobiaceae bacterium]
MVTPLLSVRDLRIDYRLEDGVIRVIDGLSFDVQAGETIALVGESGCGKSTVAKAVLAMLPNNAVVAGGTVEFMGRDILRLRQRELRDLRWREIAWIPQNAMNALDPVYTFGDQMREVMTIHGERGKERIRNRILEVCEFVGLKPDRLYAYPHQLSGGMKQRVCIAMALLLSPKFLIADEPTTALDVMLQQQIVRTIRQLQERLELTVIYISHDIALVSALCRSIAVMYAGRIVESGRSEHVLRNPAHPYTMGLRQAVPTLRRRTELISIPGAPPDPRFPLNGCRFDSRCPFRTELCGVQEPSLERVSENQLSRCHYNSEAERFRARAARAETWA